MSADNGYVVAPIGNGWGVWHHFMSDPQYFWTDGWPEAFAPTRREAFMLAMQIVDELEDHGHYVEYGVGTLPHLAPTPYHYDGEYLYCAHMLDDEALDAIEDMAEQRRWAEVMRPGAYDPDDPIDGELDETIDGFYEQNERSQWRLR